MGELPVPPGAFLEVSTRIKVLRGPLPQARIAAWPGGAHGAGSSGRAGRRAGPAGRRARRRSCELRAVIGPEAQRRASTSSGTCGCSTPTSASTCSAPRGAVVRVESLAVREVTERFTPHGRLLPGFAPSAGQKVSQSASVRAAGVVAGDRREAAELQVAARRRAGGPPTAPGARAAPASG